MKKIAVSFDIEVENGGLDLVPASHCVIASEHWHEDTIEFEYDIWEGLCDVPEFENLEDGIYHIFMYGNVSEEFSYSWEYGIDDFDGFIFEPEITLVNKIKE